MSDDELLRHLGELSYLRPDSDLADESIPDDVAERLDAAIAAAAAERAQAATGTVVTLRQRQNRWAAGLIAASVVVVAAGVITTNVNRTDQPTVVADAPVAVSAQAAPLTASAKGRGTPQPATVPQPQALDSQSAAGPAIDTSELQTAGLIPTMRVQASDTNYTHEGLNEQVTGLLADAGVTDPAQMVAMEPEPVQWPVDDGFTTSAGTLADCLSWLMPPSTTAVLIVDRASFEGSAAGVIVSNTAEGVQVWVIDPQCPHAQAGVMDHQPYLWQE